MRSYGKWLAASMVGILGGCLAVYDYDKFDGKGTAGAGGAESMVSAGTSSSGSSSSNASSGMGGQGTGGSCPSNVVCDSRPAGCTENCFVLDWAHRAGTTAIQYARSAAIDSKGNVAIAGEYHNQSFTFSDGTPKYTPSDSELANGTAFTEGFVAYFNAGGTVQWAQSIDKPSIATTSARTVTGVAFDSNNDLIVVGTASDKSTKNHVFLRKFELGTVGNSTPLWTIPDLLASFSASEGLAIATNNRDIYVLGRSESNASNIDCTGKSVLLTSGMFVAKFDGDKTCSWIKSINTSSTSSVTPIAITARNAAKNGVWITGTFTTQIETNPWPVLQAVGTTTFVLSLDDNDGKIMSGIRILPLMGTITPAAIDTLETGSAGKGTVFLAGTVVGKTQLSPDLIDKQSAAFLVALDVTPPVPMNPMEAGSFTQHPFLLTGPLFPQIGARGTGVVLRNGKLHLSGTFATSIALPPAVPEIPHSGNVPFLATFDTVGPTPLGFDSFLTGSDMEDFASNQVFLAGSAGGLALAGGWTKQLDLSTRDKPIFGVLTEIDAPPSVDVFVAKFVLPTP